MGSVNFFNFNDDKKPVHPKAEKLPLHEPYFIQDDTVDDGLETERGLSPTDQILLDFCRADLEDLRVIPRELKEKIAREILEKELGGEL